MLLLVACNGLTPTDKVEHSGQDLDSADTSSDDTEATDTTGGNQNFAPDADAGEDVEAGVGEVVELNGSGSTDPDGDTLDYTWTLLEQPGASAATLINDSFVDPQFIPDVEGRYVVQLTVSDGELESDPDTVEITATEDNGRPVANAGSDQSVAEGGTVQLDGTRSTDPDGDALAFAWTLVSRPGGSGAALTSGSTANPSFVADVAGSYQVSLTVSDGAQYSDPDIVVITASSGGGSSDSGCGCTSADPALTLGNLLLAGLVGLGLRRPRRS